jgi:hypothetical protein
LQKGFAPSDNIETTLIDFADNRMYLAARSGDPYAEDWREPSELKKIFQSIKKALYF